MGRKDESKFDKSAEECLVGIGKTFIANPQPTETVEPAQGAFDYPAPFAKALGRCDAMPQPSS
ncbi:hypothetical protein JAB1_19150 [Janthinobacterium sp. MP5059B]|nr:hypothetical protein JAB1_19150 [Janthinobacterium sp. MP5059B]